jgi:F-type H+-transporting ATPase subunit gamma
MATLRDIKRRIRSVQNTRQITRAMEMVSAAKLRRAQNRVEKSRPYAGKMQLILDNLSAASGELAHPFFEKRVVKKSTLVVVTSDRGFCGSFNHNILRRAETFLKDPAHKSVELVCVGKKGFDHFKKRGWNIIFSQIDYGGNLELAKVRHLSTELTRRFLAKETDEIFLLYTTFISTSRYRVTLERFLNIEQTAQESVGAGVDYIFEPDPVAIYDDLMPRFAMTKIQTALANSFASEHAARMVAMSAATKNAGEMIDTLVLVRNKARQAAITKELLDIVGGAESLHS